MRYEIFLTALLALGLAVGQAQEDAPAPEPAPETEAPPEAMPEEAAPPSAADLATAVPEQMRLFAGQVGQWVGLTKTAVNADGTETITNTRSQWLGGYLLNGHLFEVRGYSYGDLGRTSYRWHYSYDSLKERYLATYQDSNGRTQFFEGKVNETQTKIIWRLLAPTGDMQWHVETDLQPENGIETNGRISSETFSYDMVYTSVFKRK